MGKRGTPILVRTSCPFWLRRWAAVLMPYFQDDLEQARGGLKKEGRRRAVPEGAYGAQGAFSPGEDRGGGRALRRQAGDAVRRTFSKERS